MVDSKRPVWTRPYRIRAARRLGAIGLVAWLWACSPAFNWRDAPAPGGEFRVQLPDKPSTMSRPIHLERLPVTMTMVGARVGETAFTAALVPAGDVPQAGAATEDRLLRSMREQMLRNIGAPVDSPTRAVRVPLIEPDGRRVGDLPGIAIDAGGTGAHAGSRLQAVFVRSPGHAFQAMVIGPPVDEAQVRHFLDSFQVVRR